MDKIEEYGEAMKEVGYLNGTCFIDNPKRIKAAKRAAELFLELQKDNNEQKDLYKRSA